MALPAAWFHLWRVQRGFVDAHLCMVEDLSNSKSVPIPYGVLHGYLCRGQGCEIVCIDVEMRFTVNVCMPLKDVEHSCWRVPDH